MDPTEEGLVFAEIDLADIALAKNMVDPAGHYARPDVTAWVFNDRPQKPVISPEELEDATLDELEPNEDAEYETNQV